jgi:hypothetical protein
MLSMKIIALSKMPAALLAAALSTSVFCDTKNSLAAEPITYSKARAIAINSGWKPLDRNRGWRMSANANYDNSLNKYGIKEFWGCSGIGENICHFYFARNNKYLLIAVIGGYQPTPSSRVLYQKSVNKPEEMDF